MNWKVCKTDDKFEGALQSWKAIARCDEMLDKLLMWIDQLFRYGDGPIIWLDHPSREMAPIYLVSHHGKDVKSYACYHQWGCRYCGAATNQLYHAHWDFDQCVAAQKEVVEFLQPMLRLLPAYRQVCSLPPGESLRDHSLGELTPVEARACLDQRQGEALQLGQALRHSFENGVVPGGAPQAELGSQEQVVVEESAAWRTANDKNRHRHPPSLEEPRCLWKKYQHDGNVWWFNPHSQDCFFEATGSKEPPVKRFGGTCSKFGDHSPPDSDSDVPDGEESTTIPGGGSTQAETESTAPGDVCMLPIDADECTHRAFLYNMYTRTSQPPHGEFI